jgi:hypothetical protein
VTTSNGDGRQERWALRPGSIAAAVLILTVVGAIAAIGLDLKSQFVLGEAQHGDLGAEVILEGSATSAPLPPVLGLLIGLALARGAGKRRVVGLVLFALTGLAMMNGVIGEFTSGTSFSGFDQAVFLTFSALYAVLAFSLLVTSAAALMRRPSERARM